MKKYIVYILFFLSFHTLSAQGVKSVAQTVEVAKQGGTKFIDVQHVYKENKGPVSVKGIREIDEAFFFEYDQEFVQTEITRNQPEAISLPIILEANSLPYTLDLVEVSEDFYAYQVTTGSGQEITANTNNRHYRGVVRGKEEESIVAISFFKEQMIGLVSIHGQGGYNIGKLNNSPFHIVFHEDNLAEQIDLHCGTPDEPEVVRPSHGQVAAPNHRSMTTGRCIRIHMETRFNIFEFVHHQSVGAVENYVSGVFNTVSALYQNEQINFLLANIKVWDITDPYSSEVNPNITNDTRADALLRSFRSSNTGINGHLGQLLTFESLDSIAGIAFRGDGGSLCLSEPLRLSVSRATTLLDPVNYFRRIGTMAHEFGHSLGSHHTHACEWGPNGTTQIDDCGNVGTGMPEGAGCFDPNNPILPTTGTIMSYCDKDFSLGFGVQPGNVIRSNIDASSCLGQHYGLIDFVLKDDNDEEQEVFCWKENVYFHGTSNTGISFYQFRLLYYEASTSTWQEIPGYVEFQGPFAVQNVVTELENIGIVFESGVQYKLLIISFHQTCGVLSINHDFSFKEPSVNAAFNFENNLGQHRDVFCEAQSVFLDGRASDDGVEFCLTVERRPIGGTNYVKVLEECIDGVVDRFNFSNWMSNRSLSLQGGYEYQVTLIVRDECGVENEDTHSFLYYGELLVSSFDIENAGGNIQNVFCSGEDVFIDGRDSRNETRFRIDVSRNPIGDPNSVELISEFTDGEVGRFNFSEWMSDRSLDLEGGFEYDVRLVVFNDCFSGSDAFSGRFTVNVCCNPPVSLFCMETGGETFLAWDDVSPTSTYMLFIDPTTGTCCGNEDFVSPAGILVNDNLFNIKGIRAECFEWRVQSICGDLSSVLSAPRCMDSSTPCLQQFSDPNPPSTQLQLQKQQEVISIEVSPNPSRGQINIEVAQIEAGALQLEIINLNGQQIKLFDKVMNADKKYQQNWTMGAETSSGVYFLRVHTDQGTFYKKFIIQD